MVMHALPLVDIGPLDLETRSELQDAAEACTGDDFDLRYGARIAVVGCIGDGEPDNPVVDSANVRQSVERPFRFGVRGPIWLGKGEYVVGIDGHVQIAGIESCHLTLPGPLLPTQTFSCRRHKGK